MGKKPELTAGVANRKGVGYVVCYDDAARLRDWASERHPKKLRIVISPEIPPADAPKIISTLGIAGFESRPAEERFRPVDSPQIRYRDPFIKVINPKVLYWKNRALLMLQQRYKREYETREAIKKKLLQITGELNQIAVRAGETRKQIKAYEMNIKSLLLVRAASKPPPLHVPGRITAEDKASEFSFLVNPAFCVKHLFAGSNPGEMNTKEAIDAGISNLRIRLGLPQVGGSEEVSFMLSKVKEDLELARRKLASLDADRDLLTERAGAEKALEKALTEKVMPQIRALMFSQSAYGAEGLESVLCVGGPGGYSEERKIVQGKESVTG
ncbi:hypothetical protein ACP70R_012801 [Stipagrostis hirtigluma subsp. patula]